MNSTGRMEYVSYMNYMEFEKQENQQFLKNMPSGLTDMEARKWAFKPGNPVVEFIVCKKEVLIIGNNLFAHVGIVPEIARKYNNIGDLNKLLSLYLWNRLENINNYQDIFGSDIIRG